MKDKTKEQAVQHLEDNNLDNVQINSIGDTPYYVSDVMADFALSLSPVSELEDRWNLVQEFKESAEFKRLTLELGIDRESAIIAAGKFIDWYRNTHAQKPQLNESVIEKAIEIAKTHYAAIPMSSADAEYRRNRIKYLTDLIIKEFA